MAAPSKIAHTAPVAGTTSLAGLAYCAGPVAGDVFVLPVDYIGGSTGATSSPGTGWTLKGSVTGGGINKDIWTKVATGTETGNVSTITVTGASNSIGSMELYRSATGAITIGALVSGADTVSDTSYSATTGSTTTDSNTLMVYMVGLTATSTRTVRTLTQAGSTVGTLTAYFGSGTGITQEVGDRPVLVGATAAIVNTYTLGTACTGLTAVLLLQEVQVISTPWVGTPALGNAAGANASTLNVDVSGAANGQVVWIIGTIGGIDASDTAIVAPAGWNILGQSSEGVAAGASSRVIVLWKVKTAGDTTVTINWVASVRYQFLPISWPGVSIATPAEALTWLAHTTGTSYVTGSGTPTAANRWAVGVFESRGTTTATAWTVDTTLASRSSVINTGTNPFSGLLVADSNGTATQAAHAYTSAGQSSSHGIAGVFFLIPAALPTFAAWGIPL